MQILVRAGAGVGLLSIAVSCSGALRRYCGSSEVSGAGGQLIAISRRIRDCSEVLGRVAKS